MKDKNLILKTHELSRIKKTHRYEVRFEDPFILWDFVKEYKHHFICDLKSYGRVLYFESEQDSNIAKMLK